MVVLVVGREWCCLRTNCHAVSCVRKCNAPLLRRGDRRSLVPLLRTSRSDHCSRAFWGIRAMTRYCCCTGSKQQGGASRSNGQAVPQYKQRPLSPHFQQKPSKERFLQQWKYEHMPTESPTIGFVFLDSSSCNELFSKSLKNDFYGSGNTTRFRYGACLSPILSTLL